jgi:hypothetical protein
MGSLSMLPPSPNSEALTKIAFGVPGAAGGLIR